MVHPLLAPSSVVVIGASTNPNKAGYSLFENVAGFQGSAAGVGRQDAQVHGRRIFAGIDELDHVPDLAVLAIPPGPSIDAVAELDEMGVGAAIVCAGGFAEAGPQGAALQERLAITARSGSIRVLGPNTSGVVVPSRSMFCSFVPSVRSLRPGPLGIVAQSGGVAHSIAFAAHNEGLGLSAMVGVGNGADLSLPELAHAVADLPETSVLALHVEGLTDGAALLEVVEAVSATVPVVVLKAGRSDVDHLAASHTGALTGDWATASAMLRDAGAVVVETQTDLIDAAKALSQARLSPAENPGVGVVTGQAGPALLLVDRLQQLGVSVPPLDQQTATVLSEIVGDLTHLRNPVDTGRPGPSFLRAAEVVAESSVVDLLVLFALIEPGALDLPAIVRELDGTDVPTLLGTGGPRDQLEELAEKLDTGSGFYELPDRLARGVWALCEDSALRRLASVQPASTQRTSSIVVPAGIDLPELPVSEAAAKAVLAAVGIESPARVECAGRDDAIGAIEQIGAPVVLKIADPTIAHKSRAGGVHLGIADSSQMQHALDSIDSSVGAGDGAGYLVEEMVAPGLDLIVGARRDPNWGTVIIVGLGGTETESMGRIALFRGPLSPDRLKRQAAIAGVEGVGDLDQPVLSEVADVANALARLVDEWQGADTIEINPLRVVDGRLVALDAFVGSESGNQG